MVIDFGLHKARAEVRKAKLALKEAEDLFERTWLVAQNLPMINRIKVAERRVAEAEARLRAIEPANTD